MNIYESDFIEQKDNNLLNVNNFLDQMINEIFDKIQSLKSDIKILEEQYLSYKKDILELGNATSNTANLFSPTLKSKNQNENFELNNIIIKLESDLQVKKCKLTDYIDEKDNLINLKDYLNNLESKFNDLTKKSKDLFDIDNFNRKYRINLLEIQENERKRIARDLHDSTVQSLTNIKHKTELITKIMDIDSIRAKLELQTMNSTLKSTIDEMRTIIYDLRPMSIDDLGLLATIQRYIREVKTNYTVDIMLNIINKEFYILPVINLTLFRIVQEATTNALKHGKATRITINIEYNNSDIKLSILDNGTGFNTDNINNIDIFKSKLNGFGLSIMKERVFLLSGTIDIISDENSGTNVKVSIPIEPLSIFTEDK